MKSVEGVARATQERHQFGRSDDLADHRALHADGQPRQLLIDDLTEEDEDEFFGILEDV